MSRLFGSRSDDDGQAELPLVSDLAPQIQAEATRLEALSLPDLAAEILTKAFSAEYKPDEGMLELDGIADVFLPPHGEWTGAPWKEPPAPDALYQLHDLVREGVQVLEHAGMLMPKGYSSNGNWYHAGYVTTRRARAALADGSVSQVLSGSAAPA